MLQNFHLPFLFSDKIFPTRRLFILNFYALTVLCFYLLLLLNPQNTIFKNTKFQNIMSQKLCMQSRELYAVVNFLLTIKKMLIKVIRKQ